MSLKSVLKTLGFLLLLLVAVVSVGALYLWTQADRLLQSQIKASLDSKLPQFKIQFDGARLEGVDSVRLTDVQFSAPTHVSPPLRVPELVVWIDENLLRKHRRVLARKVTIVQPTISLDRDADGNWNFSQFAPPPASDLSLPDIEILGGTLLMRTEATPDWPALTWRCTNLNATLKPAGFKQYDVVVQVDAEHLGPVEIAGSLDIRTGTWNIRGAASRVDAQDSLVTLASGLSPQVRERMAALADARLQMRRSKAVNIIQTASVEPSADEVATSSTLPLKVAALGIAADLDIRFQAACDGPGAPLTYEARVHVSNGQITDELVPIPLYNVESRVIVDQDGLTIESLSASNGETQLSSTGHVGLKGDRPRAFTLSAKNMQLDQRIRTHLPPGLLKMYDQIQPEGKFNVDVAYQQSDSTPPRVTLKEFRVFNGRARHEFFQYRARQIEGTIKQQDDMFVLDFHGLADGVYPVTLTGEVKNPGPLMQAIIDVDCPQLPLDQKFREAFQIERQQAVRRTLVALDLGGIMLNGRMRLTREAGPNNKFKLKLDGDLTNGRINFNKFPYEIEQLEGHLRYDALGEDVWYFEKLAGVHGKSHLTGQGSFAVRPGNSLLDLHVGATELELDSDLRDATVTAVPTLDSLWTHLQPAGVTDVKDISILWTPGGLPTVELSSIQLRDGKLTISGFPYAWERMTGAAHWRDKRLTIDTLEGWHKDTYLKIDGGLDPQAPLAYVLQSPKPNVQWRAHFDRIDVRDLPLDPDLRQALPPSLQAGMDTLAPTGKTNIEASLDIKQLADEPGTITAQWRSNTTLLGNNLTTGVELKDVRGTVNVVNGVWDGEKVDMEGFIQLAGANVFDMPLTNIKAPLRIRDTQIVVGSPSFAQPPATYRPETTEYAGTLLSGKLYEGDVSLEAEIRIDPNDSNATMYAVTTTAREVNLREWARQTRRTERIRGPLNLLCTLSGKGSSASTIMGQGWAQIVDAEMYDLPVMLQVFSVLEGKGPNDAAFNYAYGDFTLHEGIVDFSDIELAGETLTLVGEGYIGFDGPKNRSINMDFYTRTGGALRRNMQAIPIVGTMASNIIRLGTEGWMQVEVLGTIDSPQAVPRLNNPLPDNLKRVVEASQFRPRRLPARPPAPRVLPGQ